MKGFKFLKKFLFISLIAVLCACFFAGCGMPYGAEFDCDAYFYVNKKFLNENRVYGAFYSDIDDYDETSPAHRIFIIKDEEKFKEIFTNYDGEVDFDKQTVVLYMFPHDNSRPCYLRQVYIEEGALIVKYACQMLFGAVGGSSMPYPRCFLLKLEKISFKEVKFIEVW